MSNLTSKNPLQQSRVQDIRGLDENWIRWAEHEIAIHANKRPTEDELLQGDVLMEQIRSRQREIVGEEERLLQVRTRKATTMSHVTLYTAVGLSIMVAGMLFTLTRRELRELSRTYEQHLEAEEEKRRQLAESRERFQTTLNSLGDAVIATDADGFVRYINPVAQQLTGWTDYTQARGRPLREVACLIDERTREPLRDPVECRPSIGKRRCHVQPHFAGQPVRTGVSDRNECRSHSSTKTASSPVSYWSSATSPSVVKRNKLFAPAIA